MVMLDTGREQYAYMMGGSLTNNAGSWYIAVGTGSKTVIASTSGLHTEADRNQITGSADCSTLNRIGYTADFSSVEMSGTELKEIGLFNIASGGKSFIQDGFANITFDGTIELQIEIKTKVF